MATIKDVAKRAGVAPSTVSRVLAGSSRISPETHERVREAMRELNYHPNAIARSLARRSTATIGLMIARPAEQALANPFFPELMRGIGSVLYGTGYNLMLSMVSTPEEERQVCLRLLRSQRVDGVILASASLDHRLVDDLLAGEFPFVLVGRIEGQSGITTVNNDNEMVGRMAVRHLVGQGHVRIGLIGGPPELTVSIDRACGYRQGLAEAGIPWDAQLEVIGSFTKEGGYRGMLDLLERPDPPTAVFAADDAMAVGALMALKDRGLHRKVALVGVNDDPLTALMDPPLSTIRIPVFELGSTAARTLVEMLKRSTWEPRSILLPSTLVIRESSAWTL
jgi:DNA-binding LacI/PurR family transcriptional regulator